MRKMTVGEFRRNLEAADSAIQDGVHLRVTRRTGQDFIVISAREWEREQETLYVLQNPSLMQQITLSLGGHYDR